MEAELRVCDPTKTDHTKDIESWRIFKIMAEFVSGFEILRKYSLAVTFFGSARNAEGDPYYDAARELSGKLAKAGFTVITGGAQGIMEAGSRGAHDVGGRAVGLNIELPSEQAANHYLTDGMTFNYFFIRKVMLSFASEVYVFFPGGFGTLDELLEILTLVQTRKIKRIPIILYGKAYWEPFTKLFEEHLYGTFKAIDKEDLKLYKTVDSIEEAYNEVLDSVDC